MDISEVDKWPDSLCEWPKWIHRLGSSWRDVSGTWRMTIDGSRNDELALYDLLDPDLLQPSELNPETKIRARCIEIKPTASTKNYMDEKHVLAYVTNSSW